MTDSSRSNTISLTRFRTALASPRAEKRVDALISADNAEEQVRALSVTDLYYLIDEVGLVDSIELLSLCSNEQIQGCVDMEIWDRDQPSIEAFLPWLAVMQENGFEFLGRVWEGLDPELTSLTLARTCDIYDKTLDEEVPDEEERDYFETPDTFFQIVLTTEDQVQAKLVHSIIEDLYRADMVQARHTIMSARSEPAAELEEMSYRWRSGRMADLGYVDFYDALEVFRPIDPTSVKIGENSIKQGEAKIEGQMPVASELPVPMLRPVVGRSFLAQALEQLDDREEIENMQAALLYLVNRIMSAGSLSPGNMEALELATLHATASVALGLESVSGGNPTQAVLALRSISLTRLHRVGYTLCLRLARYARVIALRALTAGEPTQSVLEAVLARRPFFPTVLEDPASSAMRPIESRADLKTIADHLKEVALRIAVADALEVDLDALAERPEPRPQLDDYVRSAMLRACQDEQSSAKTFSAAPLRAAELEAFRDSLTAEGITSGAKDRAMQNLVGVLDTRGVVEARDSLEILMLRWLGELQETFMPLPKDQPIDGKFLGKLVLASAMD